MKKTMILALTVFTFFSLFGSLKITVDKQSNAAYAQCHVNPSLC